MKKIIFRFLYGNSLRLTPIMLVRLWYFFKIFTLMRKMQLHIASKDEAELIKHWEASYRNKIYFLLNDKAKQVFGDENH